MLGVPGTGWYGKLRTLTNLIHTDEMGLNEPMGRRRRKALLDRIQKNKDARIKLRHQMKMSKMKKGPKQKK